MIFAIETSCDETAVALMCPHSGEVLGEKVASQFATHAPFGGVVPNLAARDHLRRLPQLAGAVMDKAGLEYSGLTCVAWTRGPGLIGALAVGANFGAGLARALDIPKLELHHMEAHIAVALREQGERTEQELPDKDKGEQAQSVLALLVSGGHSMIVHARSLGDYKVIGESRDDAVGECFDKVGRILGLPFPGGPEVERLAASNTHGLPEQPLPRPMLKTETCDMSFSGLKTAVLYKCRGMSPEEYPAVAQDFQNAIADVLVAKLKRAMTATGEKRVVVAGGVAANRVIRARISELAESMGAQVWFPPLSLCADNAVMVAELARRRLSEAHKAPASEPRARWHIEELQPPCVHLAG